MDKINVNGVEYVKRDEAVSDSEHVCVIADRGWIFEGRRDPEKPFELHNAHVVRRWSNGLGIGGLADPDHKDEYTLDALGSVEVRDAAVIAVIPLGW